MAVTYVSFRVKSQHNLRQKTRFNVEKKNFIQHHSEDQKSNATMSHLVDIPSNFSSTILKIFKSSLNKVLNAGLWEPQFLSVMHQIKKLQLINQKSNQDCQEECGLNREFEICLLFV